MVEYLSLIHLFLILVGLMIYIRKLQKTEKENLILETNITYIQKFYDDMQERIQGIRKYRHDLQKHMGIVEEFLREGRELEDFEEYQALQGYFQEMQDDMSHMKEFPYCRNELLNAICEIKAEECKEKEIPFEARVNIKEDSIGRMDPFHITGILMNLLDNALEEELRLHDRPGKGILFILDDEGESLYICVGNDVSKSFDMNFQTSKSDSKNHGLGLLIAKDYCSKYGGHLNIDFDEESSYLTISSRLVRS